LDNKDILSATLTILKGNESHVHSLGNIQPMDVFSFTQANKVTFSHLSLNWGFLADTDIESESLRLIGSARFTLYAIYLLAVMRSYEGEFYYLCQSDEKPNIEPFTGYDGPPLKYYHADPTQWHSEKLNVTTLAITNLPWISTDVLGSPDARLNDGCLYLTWSTNLPRWNAAKTLLNGRLFDPPAEYRKEIVAFYLKPGPRQGNGKEGILDLSGEKMPYEPVALEVHPGLLRIFVPFWLNEAENAK
jgi:sphingosine kinase